MVESASPLRSDRVEGTPYERWWWTRRISWGAILAGAVIALAVMLAMGLLGLAIGLTVAAPGGEPDSPKAMAIGAGVWWVFSTIVSLFSGGCVAARLAGFPRSRSGMIHGAVVWGVVTLLGIWMVRSAVGGILGGTVDMLQALGGTAGEVAKAAPKVDVPEGVKSQIEGPWKEISDELEQVAKDANANPQTRQEMKDLVDKAIRSKGDRAELKRDLANFLDKHTKIKGDDARKRVEEWDKKYQDAKDKMIEVGRKATAIAAGAAWWGFFNLLIGAAAAVVGGLVGAPKPTTNDVAVR